MIRYQIAFLLLAGFAWAQQVQPMAPSHDPSSSSAPAPASPEPKQAAGDSSLPDATAVITVRSRCGGTPAPEPTPADCKTIVVTRAEFEKLATAVQPAMLPSARRQFANRYAVALVLGQRAQELGLDQKPDFEEHMRLARLQILAQELNLVLQEKSSSISDAEIESYYEKNVPMYEEGTMYRIYIPRVQQLPTPVAPLTEAQSQKRTQESAKIMKTEAERLHTRAVAGEDFNKLQREAYLLAGIKSKSLNTLMEKVRRSTLPPGQTSAMDLKPGAVSPVLSDQSGYFIFKLTQKQILALDKVRDEIHESVRSQRMQAEMHAIEESATSTFSDEYFGPEGVQ